MDRDRAGENQSNIDNLIEIEPRVNGAKNLLRIVKDITASGKSGNDFPLEASIPAGVTTLKPILCTEGPSQTMAPVRHSHFPFRVDKRDWRTSAEVDS
jgi:hypothetical protein